MGPKPDKPRVTAAINRPEAKIRCLRPIVNLRSIKVITMLLTLPFSSFLRRHLRRHSERLLPL